MDAAGSDSSDADAPKPHNHVERAPVPDDDRWQPENDDYSRGVHARYDGSAGPSGHVDCRRGYEVDRRRGYDEGRRSHHEMNGSRGDYEDRRSQGRDHRPRRDSPQDVRRDRGSDRRAPAPSRRR